MKKIFLPLVGLILLESSLFAQTKSTVQPQNQQTQQTQQIQAPTRKKLSINGQDRTTTKKFRKEYLTASGQKQLITAVKNSAPYRHYIIQQLKKNNMPLELQYLPIVESNYKITAVSRSGATGMWQFMENSMSPMLKKNWWYDQRYDPWLSTDAAIAKLKDNYRQFKDWPTAIAAYNCGAGAMSRLIKAHPGADFWYLAEKGYLRNETAMYVPKLLAIADVIENAQYYKASSLYKANRAVLAATPEKYEYVNIKGSISLEKLAADSGTDYKKLCALNPALIRKSTPPKETWKLRLPYGEKQKVLAAFSKKKENAKEKTERESQTANSAPEPARIHVVAKGDTLYSISKKYGISLESLCKANSIKESDILSIGQTLFVPIN